MSGARLGVDVGGTFTDLVAVEHGRLVTAKVPSTPADQSEGAMDAIAAAQVDPARVAAFAHGMTVATNALLERRGARLGLVTTEGFRDLLEIGRQDRASLYDLTAHRPPPLVPRERRFTVRERIGPQGVLVPLDEDDLAATIAALAAAEVEAIAVCLLFSFLDPRHERRVGEAVRAALPGVPVSLSSEVLPEFREYERCSTTAADAYLAPRLGGYLHRLAERAARTGVPRPLVMRSSGGVADMDAAAEHAAGCVLSGPAGGVVGAAYAASASGLADVLSFDMGGTSTDVAPIRGGEAAVTNEAVVAGVPIRLPMVDVHTVSAGGGSIAWADPGGALRVGPRSAGADPGPASYGLGGAEPTVTDANLALGYLDSGTALAGGLRLSGERALEALRRVGAPLGLDPLQTALGTVRVANAEMARALRVVTVERGLDPRDFALVAFGGAGGTHACALAEDLGIASVLVPRAAGVLSALGLAISDLRRDEVAAHIAPVEELRPAALEEAFAALSERASAGFERPLLRRRADLRYRRQAFELTVDADDPVRLRARFETAHEARYGYRMADEPVEVVALRVTATVAVERPPLRATRGRDDARLGARSACFDGEWRDTAVLDGAALERGAAVRGPAVVQWPEATCVVRPGWSGEVDGAGALLLRREAGG